MSSTPPNTPPPPKPKFGDLLRQYRQASGLTADKLAKLAKTTSDALKLMESGVRIQANPDEISRLADFLGLDDQERALFFKAAPLSSSTPAAPTNIDQGQPAIQIFLIADVRGYTHFTLKHGDEAAARLTTRFAMLVREVVTLRGGRLIELRGDEALACFSSVRQALQAAVEMQEHFIQASKADVKMPLNVGIGLDAGEAVPTQDGYRGASLNLAARLCSLAGAGEVLVSEVVTHLARKVEGLAYRTRGAAELKGFDEPVRIIAVQRAVVDEAPAPPPAIDPTRPIQPEE
jgi:class 3 adenylate cyclase